jgi:hypothetical protein
VHKPQFGVLNQAESELHEASCCAFCERPLDVSDQEEENEETDQEKEAESDHISPHYSHVLNLKLIDALILTGSNFGRSQK